MHEDLQKFRGKFLAWSEICLQNFIATIFLVLGRESWLPTLFIHPINIIWYVWSKKRFDNHYSSDRYSSRAILESASLPRLHEHFLFIFLFQLLFQQRDKCNWPYFFLVLYVFTVVSLKTPKAACTIALVGGTRSPFLPQLVFRGLRVRLWCYILVVFLINKVHCSLMKLLKCVFVSLIVRIPYTHKSPYFQPFYSQDLISNSPFRLRYI